MSFSEKSTEEMYERIRKREYRGLIGSASIPKYAFELVGGPHHGQSGAWTHTLEPDRLGEHEYQFVILAKENQTLLLDAKPWDVLHRYIVSRKVEGNGGLLMYAYYDGVD